MADAKDGGHIAYFDLSRPAIRDAIIAIVLSSLVLLLVLAAAALRQLSWLDGVPEVVQLQVVSGVLVVGCVVAIRFGFTRIRYFNEELRARRSAEERALALERHDTVTGVANRRFFVEQIDAELAEAHGEAARAAVLVVDIDGMKAVFDQHGARIADKAIIELAARLSATGVMNVWGRTDYSAFATLQAKVRSFDDPTRLAHRLILAATEPLHIDGVDLTRSVNIGIAVSPDDGAAGDILLRRAETACERAKQDGRNSVCFFDHEMDSHVQKRARIEQELRAAIPRSDIILHYQPIFSLVDERVIGFEALARWRSPKLGWVQPNVFVGIAEECGLMHELGTQLLRRACREAKAWPEGLTLAFNVSPRQSRDRALGLRILSVLDETGFDPRRLQVEISDRAVLEDSDSVRQGTEELGRAGVQLALSGFGTGYATVSQLLQLRLDKIKIARSIVHRLGKDAESEVIVRGMVAMAGSLGLGVMAEGIETSEQLAKLTAAGCTEGQGFLFGKAVPPGEIQTILRRMRRLNRNARPTFAPAG